MQLQAELTTLAGAWPSRVPLPAIKLEAEMQFFLALLRQATGSVVVNREPAAVLSCHGTERPAARASLSKQTLKAK